MDGLHFRKKFNLADLPDDWQLTNISIDYSGQPLLLISEGKPKRPASSYTQEEWIKWRRTPAKLHHAIYWENGVVKSIQFSQSQGVATSKIQRLGTNWLVGEARGGRALIYKDDGTLTSSIDLGDAINDLQITADGKIWVSYFDEGVFGGALGQHGLVCFDHDGHPIFQYADFAISMTFRRSMIATH